MDADVEILDTEMDMEMEEGDVVSDGWQAFKVGER